MSGNVIFAYPQALTYSGQTAATQLAARELGRLGWNCTLVEFAALDRSRGRASSLATYLFGLFKAWVALAWHARQKDRILCFSHGQSMASFLRMGVPHLALRWLNPSRYIVTSLHGNVFMTWSDHSKEMRFLMRLLTASDAITVLGNNQRDQLIELGVPANRITVVTNTADLTVATVEQVSTKQAVLAENPEVPLVLLHLSLLIESKGYIEFLEACLAFVQTEGRPTRPIEILLVGPIALTSYCTRFTSPESNRAWIETKIKALNAVPDVLARWIEGAQGAEKEALFGAAHVFVFPSRFPVEAQPLVLLEAMAAGCAVITSDQGEIPSTVGDDAGVCLADVSVPRLTEAIGEYAFDHDWRMRAAISGHRRAVRNFSASAYGENWDKLLSRDIQEGEA